MASQQGGGAAAAASKAPQLSTFGKGDKTKQDDVRTANIVAAKGLVAYNGLIS